ncbi:MAG TPA: hypothetical protein VLM76_04550 [Patescibacteria group bacterium]|nr:hypothetical protein [Patescibacteria group bacterium]
MAENDPTTGATPGPGATPAQAGPATTAPADHRPATGEDDLGEAGKKVLRELRSAERDAQRRAEAAERELADLRSATDSEKALAQARHEAAAEERAKFETKLRRAEVRSALRIAGLANDALVELALKSDLFAALPLDEEGRVTDLEKAIAQLRKDVPELFAPASAGTVTRGVQTPQPDRPRDLESSIRDHYEQKH